MLLLPFRLFLNCFFSYICNYFTKPSKTQKRLVAMNWYSWLSKTNLELTFVHKYGLAFAQNELEEGDLAYFNHDFLQSIGITIAKHRLEILKLARKEAKRRLNSFSRLVLAMNKTKKLFTNISKLSFHTSSYQPPVSEQWSGALKKINDVKENQQEKATMITPRNITRSGPLDTKTQAKFMLTSRSINVSGPLDGKFHERPTYPNWSPMLMGPADGRTKERLDFFCRSPTISRPIDSWGLSPKVNYCRSEKLGGGGESLWSLMFQDMKPT